MLMMKKMSQVAEEPLSQPPSPFLSKEVYLTCFKTSAAMKLEARSAEKKQNRVRMKRLKHKKEKLKTVLESVQETPEENSSQIPTQEESSKVSLDDDRMSLSSLSSDDNTSSQIEPPNAADSSQPMAEASNYYHGSNDQVRGKSLLFM